MKKKKSCLVRSSEIFQYLKMGTEGWSREGGVFTAFRVGLGPLFKMHVSLLSYMSSLRIIV